MTNVDRRRSYRPGGWFGIFGDNASVLLPPSEKHRVTALWELVDEGAGFDEVLDGLLATGLRDLPGFVLVSEAAGMTKIVLRGAAVAAFVVDGDMVELAGATDTTWVERSLVGVTQMFVQVEATDEDEGEDLLIENGLVRLGRVDQPPFRLEDTDDAAIGAGVADEADADDATSETAAEAPGEGSDRDADPLGLGLAAAATGVGAGFAGGRLLGGDDDAAGSETESDAESEGAESEGAESEGAESEGAEPEGAEPEGAEAAEPGDSEPGESPEPTDEPVAEESSAGSGEDTPADAEPESQPPAGDEATDAEPTGEESDDAAPDESTDQPAEESDVETVSWASPSEAVGEEPESGESDGPTDEGSNDEGPNDEGPNDEGPNDEGPNDQTPTDETPTDETSTEETSLEEAPADEPARSAWARPEPPVEGAEHAAAEEVPADGLDDTIVDVPAVEDESSVDVPDEPPGSVADEAPDQPEEDGERSPWQPAASNFGAMAPSYPPDSSLDSLDDPLTDPLTGPVAEARQEADEPDGMTRGGREADPSPAGESESEAAPEAKPESGPAVARLLFSSGDEVGVDRPVLVGRAPEVRRFGSHDQPRLVPVPSPHQEISATHLEVRPGVGADHGSAVVTDLGSTNGTVLVQPGLPPEDLQPGIAVQLVPGAIIDLGDGVTIQVARA